MRLRSDLVAEARELVALYRGIASETATPQDLQEVGFVLGRALEALDRPRWHGSEEQAAAELDAARVTIERLRRALDR
jgi:hypothetical protein